MSRNVGKSAVGSFLEGPMTELPELQMFLLILGIS